MKLVIDARRLSAMLSLAAFVGALSGLAGAWFQAGIAALADVRQGWIHSFGELGWVASMAATGGLAWLAVFLVRRLAPEAGGSGVQEIEGVLAGERELRWARVLPVKFAGGVLSLGSGMALGREGPTIQMGGALAQMVAELFRLKTEDLRILVAAGAGAGLAAAFNAPLAGILLVVEEMRDEFRYDFVSVQSVLVACVVADVVLRLLVGQQPDIPMQIFDRPTLGALALFAVFGALFGVMGVVFNRTLIRFADFFAALSGWRHGAMVLGAGGMIGLALWFWPDAVGGGYEVIAKSLSMAIPMDALLLLFMVRFFTTLLSYGSGAPGGIFAPMLALGTVFGVWFGDLAQAWLPDLVAQPGIFAVAGMGALFTATVRAPLTGIVLVVEMTQNYTLILPLMVTCFAAATVAALLGGRPIYTLLLKRTLDMARLGPDYFRR